MVKLLLEKRNLLIAEMDTMLTKAKIETRAFNAEENTRIESVKAEIKDIDSTIKTADEMKAFEKRETVGSGKNEIPSISVDLMDNKVIKLEERATTAVISTGGNTAVGAQTVQTTLAKQIIKKAEYVSDLYKTVNKIVTSSPLTIPLQGNKIGKFVKTAELANAVVQNADFVAKTLGATKYTNMFVVSEELANDANYNLESELVSQTTEALATTLDELLIIGDAVETFDGLAMLPVGCEKISTTIKGITSDEIVDLFYSLPIQYRANASWVMSDGTVKMLAKLKDTMGRPLLFESFNTTALDGTMTLLGRPVIINNFVPSIDAATVGKCVYFGDLARALTVGVRTNLTMQRSTEFGFLNGSIAVKSIVRLDAKLINTTACMYLKSKIV